MNLPNSLPVKSVFVTGTDTGVGKTIVSAHLAMLAVEAGKSVCVYKPIQTGANGQPEDSLTIQRLCGPSVSTHTSYCFEIPAAPFVSDVHGEIRFPRIQADYQRLASEFDVVIVEGAGGVRVPITATEDMRDLMRLLGLPVVLVARPNLGTINHTLLSVESLLGVGLTVEGVIVSGGHPPSPLPQGEGGQIPVAEETLLGVFGVWLPVPVLGVLPVLEAV